MPFLVSELCSLSFMGTTPSDTLLLLLLAEAVCFEGVAGGVLDEGEGLFGVAGVGVGSSTFHGLC